MPRCADLLKQARTNPKAFKARKLEQLAECWGYVFSRSAGSHKIYKHASLRLPREVARCTFSHHGKDAEAYQVLQLIRKIDFLLEHYPEIEPN